eukprot:GHVR01151236.1.p1 GENE.GHVR01151236.1~~GHVR01151236.1.p1  ORF type:complete len:120 (-),score=20.91 GHVR01151236.1:343-702(-)
MLVREDVISGREFQAWLSMCLKMESDPITCPHIVLTQTETETETDVDGNRTHDLSDIALKREISEIQKMSKSDVEGAEDKLPNKCTRCYFTVGMCHSNDVRPLHPSTSFMHSAIVATTD